MEIISTAVCYVVVLYVVYKILDRLVRIPRVGNYRNRSILITGCDTGFGNAAAKRLDRLGCRVFACCLTETGQTDLRKVCSDRLRVIQLDVTQRESVRRAFDCVSSELPRGEGLWGILNNAGVANAYGPPDWFTVDDYRKACEVNLWGLIDVTLTFLPLVKRAKGRIVNTSSMGGRLCLERSVPYCLSKFGVEAFTDGIRQAMHVFGCRASLIEPGAFRTGMFLGLGAELAKSWERAPQEIRDEYGERYFRHMTATEMDKLSMFTSTDIEQVVDAYEHALLGLRPRARYVVGVYAKVFLPLLWMPEWLGDWVERVLVAAPIPHAAKK